MNYQGKIQKEYEMKCGGAITVYCSLVFLLLLALICVMLESAHQTGIRIRIEQAADAGLDSLFSMYDRDLFEEYGLMFLDGSFGVGNTNNSQIISYCREYIEFSANMNNGLLVKTPQFLAFELGDVSIGNCYYATDDNGVFFAKEAVELMKYQASAKAAASFAGYLEQVLKGEQAYDYVIEQNNTYENTDWGALAEEANSEKDDTEEDSAEEDAIEEKENYKEEESSEEEKTSEGSAAELTGEELNQEIDKSLEGSILTQIEELIQDGLLSVFISDISVVSEKKIKSSQLPSKQESNSHGINRITPVLEGALENVLYNEYLLSYFGSYRNGLSSGELSYEIEYVLNGGDTDKENLLAVLEKLLLIRMGLNLIFLLGNTAYYKQAADMAQALVGWTGMAALIGAVTLLLLAVWSFSESVLDVRALLAGKNIPLYKSVSAWTSSLSNCISLVASHALAKNVANGFSYEFYLRILLLMQTDVQKVKRSMDVIQWNMALVNRQFRMENCIYAMEISLEGTAYSVFGKFGRLIGVGNFDKYKYRVNWAMTY